MLRKTLSRFAAFAGTAVWLYLAAFFMAAWGKWSCGINNINLALLRLIGAILLSASIAGRRGASRNSALHVALPWMVLAGLYAFLFALAPDCPFPSPGQ